MYLILLTFPANNVIFFGLKCHNPFVYVLKPYIIVQHDNRGRGGSDFSAVIRDFYRGQKNYRVNQPFHLTVIIGSH